MPPRKPRDPNQPKPPLTLVPKQPLHRPGTTPRYATSYSRHGERSPEAREAILAALRLGIPYKVAAAAGGYSESGLHHWLKDDEDFRMQCKQARANFAVDAMKDITAAGKADARNWTARAWQLERTMPDQFGRTVREKVEQHTTVTGMIAQRIEIVYVDDWRGKGAGDGEGQIVEADTNDVEQLPEHTES